VAQVESLPVVICICSVTPLAAVPVIYSVVTPLMTAEQPMGSGRQSSPCGRH